MNKSLLIAGLLLAARASLPLAEAKEKLRDEEIKSLVVRSKS
jgi:hypothetical protein